MVVLEQTQPDLRVKEPRNLLEWQKKNNVKLSLMLYKQYFFFYTNVYI
jgi:hypothetical protein